MTDSANSTDSTVTDAPERRPADTQPPADYPADLAWPPRFTFALLHWDVYLSPDGLAEIDSNGDNIGDTMGSPCARGVFDSEAAAMASHEDWLISCYPHDNVADHARHREAYPPRVFPVKWRWLQRQIANENPLVWHAESWWKGNADIWRDHFTSVSTTDSTLLAYVQTPQKGQKGIRTPVKPGRYLTKFFGSILTEKQIAFYATWQATGAKPNGFDSAAYQLRFAHTPKEIEEVYISGPVSCMSDDADAFDGVHPCRVYGAGDLAIAWLQWSDGDEPRAGRPMARALCWPAKKVFGRVYPNPESWSRDGFRDYAESEDAQRALAARLMTEGYQDIQCVSGGFDGARLLKIECDSGSDRYVMPYLDRGYSVGDNGGRYFYMCRSSGAYESVYECTSTDGWIDCGPGYDAHCERCETRCFLDNTSSVVVRFRHGRPWHTQIWCDSCVENYTFTCSGCDETVDDDIDSDVVHGSRYAEPWLQENASYSERFETWVLEDESTVLVMTSDGAERWPEDVFNAELKAGTVFACPIAAVGYADSEDVYCMTDVGVTCAVTGRLLNPAYTHRANGFRVGVDVTADMVTDALREDAVLHAAPEVPAAVIWPAECQMRLPLPPAVFGHDTAYAAGFSIAAE